MSKSTEHIWICGVCNKPFVDEGALREHTDRLDAEGNQHDGEPWGSITPCVVARWTDDCQGKKDFDGSVVELSTRYWPGANSGYGVTLLSMAHNGHVREELVPHGSRHHAHTSICLVRGTGGDLLTLAGEHFFGDSFDEVKLAVEAWAQRMVARVWRTVIAEFAGDEPERGWKEGADDE